MGFPILSKLLCQGLPVELKCTLKKKMDTFGTGYGIEHIGFTPYFSSKSTGSVFQVPSVPLNNYSNFYNILRNSLRCVSLQSRH